MAKAQPKNQRRNIGIVIAGIAIIVGIVGYAVGWITRPTVVSTCISLSLSQGSASGAAGTIYKNAVITNTGNASCTITGYPGVFMQGDNGVQVGNGAAAKSLYTANTVTLAPGGQAHTVIGFPQQPNFPPDTCSTIGSSMKMYIPGLATPLVTPWSDYSCPGFSATAIQPGAE